jgi:ABC-type multidrug transport system ATPase subunit
MLAGFMIPTAGTARMQDHDVQTDSVAARRVLGFPPEGAPTYPEMPVEGFLRFCARVRGFSGAELADRVDHALGLTTRQGVRLQPVETSSKGFKRQVGLAQALQHDPPVLVLDKPTDGLDPNRKHKARGLIERILNFHARWVAGRPVAASDVTARFGRRWMRWNPMDYGRKPTASLGSPCDWLGKDTSWRRP